MKPSVTQPDPTQQHAEAEQREDRPGDPEGEVEQFEESGHQGRNTKSSTDSVPTDTRVDRNTAEATVDWQAP